MAVAAGPEGMAANSAGQADDAAAGRAATAAATDPAQPLRSDPGTCTCTSTSYAVKGAKKGAHTPLLRLPVAHLALRPSSVVRISSRVAARSGRGMSL